MTSTIEINDELRERLEGHLEDDETIEELLSVYETEGAFLQEGYSE